MLIPHALAETVRAHAIVHREASVPTIVALSAPPPVAPIHSNYALSAAAATPGKPDEPGAILHLGRFVVHSHYACNPCAKFVGHGRDGRRYCACRAPEHDRCGIRAMHEPHA